MAHATCPGCGTTIEFKIGGASSVVCANCKSVVARSDRGVENLGRVGDVVFSDVALAVHDRGSFRGRAFEVAGRIVYRHPAGGSWEEYIVHFSDGAVGVIAEAQGRWTVLQRVDAHPPPFQALLVGQAMHLGQFGDYVVGEKNTGTFVAGEGDLLFSAAPGSDRSFADLSGSGGLSATVDYGDGTSAPVVYAGTECTFEELGVERRGIDRGERIDAKSVNCPSCGAPVPICAPRITERIACRFCGAISDLGKNEVISLQQRREPWIPIGSSGALEGVTWTVIGYLERSALIEGESYFWNEYLLYEPNHGYRWLVFDEGAFAFGEALAPGDVDLASYPHVIRAKGTAYRRRNSSSATVVFALGEFYWKVHVGETVRAEDFENGRIVVSSEQSEGEINWTLSRPMDVVTVQSAFGIGDSSTLGAAPQTGVVRNAESATPLQVPRSAALVLLGIILLIFFVLRMPNSDDDDTTGGFRSNGSPGGIGGK